MAADSLYISSASRIILPRATFRCLISELQRIRAIKFGIFLGLVTFAIAVAPERPEQLASICEKHHSVDACRVW